MLSETHEPGTVKVRYRGLYRFCVWLVDEDELPSSPMGQEVSANAEDEAGTDHQRRRPNRTTQACAGKEFNDRRDEALIRLLLDCDVRVS
jgi:site-specific recombinase XerC